MLYKVTFPRCFHFHLANLFLIIPSKLFTVATGFYHNRLIYISRTCFSDSSFSAAITPRLACRAPKGLASQLAQDPCLSACPSCPSASLRLSASSYRPASVYTQICPSLRTVPSDTPFPAISFSSLSSPSPLPPRTTLASQDSFSAHECTCI